MFESILFKKSLGRNSALDETLTPEVFEWLFTFIRFDN
jgi:hypothetical protein